MTHNHVPEVVGIYYCRGCHALLVKVPWPLEVPGKGVAWGFRFVELQVIKPE